MSSIGCRLLGMKTEKARKSARVGALDQEIDKYAADGVNKLLVGNKSGLHQSCA